MSREILSKAIADLKAIDDQGLLSEAKAAFSADCRAAGGRCNPSDRASSIRMMRADQIYQAGQLAKLVSDWFGLPLTECEQVARDTIVGDPWAEIALDVIAEYRARIAPTAPVNNSDTKPARPRVVNELQITCGTRNDRGVRLVVAKFGAAEHRHKFDVDSQFHRKQFREAVISKFSLEDGAHEFLESQLMAAAASNDSAPIYKPVVRILSNIAPEAVQWLWKPRLVIGKVNLLGGDPGLGKSLITIDMAARVTSGTGYPDARDERHEPGGVVILTTEDDAEDALVPRAIAHGADLSLIAHVEGMTETDGDGSVVRGIDLTRDLEVVGAAMDQVRNCKLIIIDTLNSYLGKVDSHKAAEVMGMMTPLKQLAYDRGVAVLATTHFRKGEGRAVQQLMGSMGFVGAARTAWAVTRCPSNPRRRLMTCIKNNYGDDTSGLAYTIEPYGPDGSPVICWESEPVRMSAEEAMAATQKRRGPEPKERQDAAEWLRGELANGPRPAKDILTEAEGHGFNDRTVRRAFEQMDGKREKRGFSGGWLWSLPEDDTEDCTFDQTVNNLSASHLRENTEENTTTKRTSSILPAKGTGSGCGDTFDPFEAEIAELNGQPSVPF